MKAVTSALLFFFCFFTGRLCAQTKPELVNGSYDSILTPGVKVVADTVRNDTTLLPVHNPRKATLRSAILPGWGQAYNKQYWKIPLVYGVIGVPAATYFYNHSWYKKSKLAYEIRVANDTGSFNKIEPKLQVLSTESLRFYRNEFRRSRDYSILYTLLAWGLNVVDATVSGHLKEFDVSDDLSMRINPIASPFNNAKGLSLIVAFKQPSHKKLIVR